MAFYIWQKYKLASGLCFYSLLYSYNSMNKPITLNLLRTEAHSCSYLDNLLAITEFVSPEHEVDLKTYQAINDAGFRRSGQHFYRPNCDSCSQCKPLRVLSKEFIPTKSQKRILRLNTNIEISVQEKPDADIYFDLYKSYILERHQDGDMCPPDREQFDNFICAAPGCTRFLEFRSNSNKLLMVAVCDFLPYGLSAIYSFFDPQEEQRSLGSYAILAQINIAKKMGLPYLFLGYWIEESPKMNYKSRFKPCEVLENGDWSPICF